MFASHTSEEAGGYLIANSVRLRRAALAHLSRTPSSAGNRVKWTWSGWVKRGQLGLLQSITSVGNVSAFYMHLFEFQADDTLRFYYNDGGTTEYLIKTTRTFRDPSAHVHLTLIFDVANVTTADRVRIYVNGVRETSFSTANTFPNEAGPTSAVLPHSIGRTNYDASRYFDGLLSEVYFIDGQALDPSYFGQLDVNGVWVPKAYTGTYGANGFYLPFNDGSNLTNLCLDRSGNGNNWTTTNVSLTAGPTYDWMVDTPTNNYAVLNSLNPIPSGVTYSEGNLKLAIGAPAGGKSIRTTMPFPSSGKVYLEFLSDNGSDASTGIGFGFMVGSAWYYLYASSAAVLLANGSTQASGLALIAGGVTYQLALDAATGKAWIGRNNVWYNSTGGTTGDPSTGANPTFTLPAGECFPFIYGNVTTTITFKANCGQRPHTYTPPTGFGGLNTANMPAVAVPNGRLHHEVITVTKSGNTNFPIPWDATAYDTYFEIKRRDAGGDWYQIDGLRGYDKVLKSNSTAAETTDANVLGVSGTTGTLKSTLPDGVYVISMHKAGLVSARQWNFDGTLQRTATMSIAAPCVVSLTTHGFSDRQAVQFTTTGTLPTGVSAGATYYAKSTGAGTFTLHPTEADALAGTSAVNTSGSQSGTHTCEHASRVSANVTAGFSIALYGGSGANATVGHSLGVALKMVVDKALGGVSPWPVFHTSAPSGLYLNQTSAQDGSQYAGLWNSTAPTSSVFSLGTSSATNTNGITYVAYCHAEVPGYSKFGSFTCNASADGPLGYLGFTAKSLELKASTNASNWFDWDTVRSPTNPMGQNGEVLFKQSTGAEGNSGHLVDANANAFKVRTAGGYGFNESGQTTVYSAYAKHPFGGSNVAPAPAR